MKRPLLSPPLSPHKCTNNGIPKAPAHLIPTHDSKRVKSSIIILTDELATDMVDDIDSFNKPKLLIFLDAQGKQFIESFQNMFEHLDLSVIYVSYGLKDEDEHANVVDNQQCITLTKYFKVLHPLGGGVYPLNYLMIVCNGLVRLQAPIRLSQHNAHERFGVGIKELVGFIEEIIPFLYSKEVEA